MIGVEDFDDARLMDASGKTLAKNAAYFRGDVDSDFIEQRHRSHRHAEVDHRGVDRFDRVAFLEEKSRLVHVGTQDAIDDEAGAVVADDNRFAELARKIRDRHDRFIGRLRPANHFHQRHAIDRIEKVHADNPLGMLCVRRDVGDRQRRRVAGEDCSLLRDRFEFGQDFPFDLQIFDDRLNHEIGVLVAGPVGGRRDARDFPLHLTARNAASLDLPFPDFRGRFQSARERVPVDVPHPDERIGLVGKDVRDPPAHHARPQHADARDLARLGGDFVLLRLLHHEEEPHEILRDVAEDQRGDFFDFAFESPLDPARHSRFHDFDRLERRRVVAVRFGQDGFARFAENDRARDRIALDVEPRPRLVATDSESRELFRDVEENRAGNDFID